LKVKEESGSLSLAMATTQLEDVSSNGGVATDQSQWRKSVKKHTIECLECGATFKQLSIRHLKDHNLDARAYRTKYGIPRTQPLSAKDTTAMRKKIVQKSRPWEKAPTYMKAHASQTAVTPAVKTSRAKKKAAVSA
jgi:predicted transcriptional regulator